MLFTDCCTSVGHRRIGMTARWAMAVFSNIVAASAYNAFRGLERDQSGKEGGLKLQEETVP